MSRSTPTLVPSSSSWAALDVDTFGGCAIEVGVPVVPDGNRGRLACWGRNVEGQLGTGDVTFRAVPAQSGTFDDWIAIAVGRFHTCGMRADHTLWCTGANAVGQLGVGDRTYRSDWTQVLWP
jgi:hypothetical protein